MKPYQNKHLCIHCEEIVYTGDDTKYLYETKCCQECYEEIYEDKTPCVTDGKPNNKQVNNKNDGDLSPWTEGNVKHLEGD